MLSSAGYPPFSSARLDTNPSPPAQLVDGLPLAGGGQPAELGLMLTSSLAEQTKPKAPIPTGWRSTYRVVT